MSDVILKAEGISKQYRLGVVGTGTLSHDLNRFWHRIRGKEDPYAKVGAVNDRSTEASEEYVWALRDINFEVKKGEVLGIIGKNGAGKSTLLKILSRVTGPTTGSIKTKGRIASLLEVGTGFHPELTGRENIYLNGAILGMTKAEVNAKIDEIIAFSGCQKYVDTPTKRYSSGMRVRLAFAVAAHLEPEILVIDEVLAVGDAEFQKKAIGKMQDISQGEGRTVLFVSHNMTSVKSLCTRAIVIDNGTSVFDGTPEDAISFYLKDGRNNFENFKSFDSIYIDNVFRLKSIGAKNENAAFEDIVIENKKIEIITSIEILDNPTQYHLTYHLVNEMEEPLFSTSNRKADIPLKKGLNNLTFEFPADFLQAGTYHLKFLLVEKRKRPIFVEDRIFSFNVVNSEREIGVYMGKEPGSIKPSLIWKNND